MGYEKGLITESFKINSGNSATKRKQEEALATNYRLLIHPHTLDFNRKQSPLSSPICTPSKRRVLGEIQNSPLFRPKDSPTIERLKNTPTNKQNSPLIELLSPLTSKSEKCKRTKVSKISRIFEDRTKYRIANKENDLNVSQTFITMNDEKTLKHYSSKTFHQTDNKKNESLTRSEAYFKMDNIQSDLSTTFSKTTHMESYTLTKSERFFNIDSLHRSSNESDLLIKSEKFEMRSNVFSKMESKETTSLDLSGTFVKLDVEEETRDCPFSDAFRGASGTSSNWCRAKLDFTDALHSKSYENIEETKNIDMFVPEKDTNIDTDFETLHDLEEEFDCTNFDECSKYEIISTDSPNIISSGRSTSRKIDSRNFEFGAPLLDNEQSTSFNKPHNVNATRMLNFDDENFEFTSPAVKKLSVSNKKSLRFSEKSNMSVKKSLKFTETPTKTMLRHERSDSSIGSMSMSPASTKLRIFPSDSTTSMESGFISELEDQFLDYEVSNSPKIANFKELLSGQIKDSFGENQLLSGKIHQTHLKENINEPFNMCRNIMHGFEEAPLSSEEVSHNFGESSLLSGEIKNILVEKPFTAQRSLQRSLSFNPEVSRARVSLFSIKETGIENQEKKNNKRNERIDLENISSKRRRSNCQSPESDKPMRPVLHRAFSENHASIMSAMTRFETEPGLIGDFTLPFALPLTIGEHSDLNSISCDTLAGLLRGDYADSISEFQVIDCRYPYEYDGGHIAGAVNLYTPEQVLSLVEAPHHGGCQGRRILVFHCEFSRERGPKLSRFLRSKDRLKNKENYPSLHYPEVYLLHEGYRAFYTRHPSLCSPAGYTTMLDPHHRGALKKHRSFSQPSTNTRRNRLLH